MSPLADRARALLAEADGPAVPDGREPASVALQPSDGEVAELVECLRRICFDVAPCDADAITRAAELLEQHHPAPPGEERIGNWLLPEKPPLPEHWSGDLEYGFETAWETARALLQQRYPAPVPVSERLPGPEDCDEQGRCWWHGEGADMFGWTLDAEGASYYRAKFWLPANAHALPTPEATND